VDLAIQIAVFLIMAIVGLDLTRTDFARLGGATNFIMLLLISNGLSSPIPAGESNGGAP